jgi:beta-N-acetylhexosaminidase
MKIFIFISFIIIGTVSQAKTEKLSIINKPIKIDMQVRKKLINEYVKLHYPGVRLKDDLYITPRYIVIHSTATSTFKQAYNIFNKNFLAGRPDIHNAGRLNVSTPFLVDKNGKIYRLHDELMMARHCIGLNYASIGIENVGVAGKKPLTAIQLNNNVKLVTYLVKKYPTIKYLIGHSEYRLCENKEWFKEKDDNYRTTKIDPGKNFMKMLRSRLRKQGIHLKNCNN